MNPALEIIAGPAFGDGSHPSTQGVQLAMEALLASGMLNRPPERVLDVGAGSGILSLLALRLWPEARVIASDTNPASPRLIEENARRNGLEGRIRALQAAGLAHEDIQSHAPYDLILCNITAAPIIQMADEIAHGLAADGAAILSGILVWRQMQLEEAYALHGLYPLQVIAFGDWRTLVMGRLPKPSP
jgi:ribosomal protein L11 methyltransferase